jgi:hypothetical protein
LSSVATRYPGRVAALVYLEAGYPYAFDNGNGPTMKEFQEKSRDIPVPALTLCDAARSRELGQQRKFKGA